MAYRTNLNPKVKARLRATPTKNKAQKKKDEHWRLIAGLLLIIFFGVVIWWANGVARESKKTNVTSTTTKSVKTANETRLAHSSSSLSLSIPYSKTIGFVGDSLTYGCCSNATPAPTDEVKLLGSDYKAINRGVNGATTADWRNNLLDDAIIEFKKQEVEVVQVMLGTNDVAQKITADDTINNLRTIARRLIDDAGVKVVIINQVPFSSQRDDVAMRAINARLGELVDGEHVFLGDTSAYDFFRRRQDILSEGLHMTEGGYRELGQLWAEALKRIVVEPKNVKATVSPRKVSSETTTLNFTVSKSAIWWGVNDYAGLFIDGERLDVGASGLALSGDDSGVKVTFSGNRLNELKAGEHNIELRYLDGTKFSAKFEARK